MDTRHTRYSVNCAHVGTLQKLNALGTTADMSPVVPSRPHYWGHIPPIKGGKCPQWWAFIKKMSVYAGCDWGHGKPAVSVPSGPQSRLTGDISPKFRAF